MARAAKIYDFTCAPNGAFTLLVEGSYYRILSSTGIVEVRRDGGSGIGPLSAGQGEEDEFKRLTIIDKTGAANSGFVVVSDGTFVDQRITGEVSVIDGGKNRTFANSAYFAMCFSPAVAAQFAKSQLWNPAGSGKNLIIESMIISSTAASDLIIRSSSAALANAPTTTPSTKLIGTASASVALLKYEAAAAVVEPALFLASVGAAISYSFYPKEPIILRPGNGLLVNTQTANIGITASFEWFEESI